MVYQYACSKCNIESEVVKPHTECSNPEHCLICNTEMQRVWTVPQVNCPIPPAGYYNHGLGRVINSKRDIRDAQIQHKDRTGFDLIELGNDKPKSKPKEAYSYSNEAAKAKQLLGV
jgi:predicted nucleic acid-binding Zn ribbon protein